MGSLELTSGEQVVGQGDLITLDGDLDVDTAPVLKELLFGLIDTGSANIILDCKLLNHIDSSGLGALVGALKQSADGDGTLALACPNQSVRRVLHITGLDILFPIYRTVADARNANPDVWITPAKRSRPLTVKNGPAALERS